MVSSGYTAGGIIIENQIRCPGENTLEIQYCAKARLDKSQAKAKEALSPALYVKWQSASLSVCEEAYSKWRQGSIYKQVILSCRDNLNQSLLKELDGLGD